MGCDIHCYAEVNKSGIWEKIGDMFKNPWYNPDKDDSFYKEFIDHPYDDRNYNLYAILANVRNGYDLIPIAYPKGLPEDVSDEIKSNSDDWCGDGHSHSWFTFKELLDFDWKNNSIENEAWVSEEVYKQFKETGNPYPCSGGVDGGNIRKETNKEMNRIIKNKYPWEKEYSFYTIIKWNQSFLDAGQGLLDNLNEFIKSNNISDEELSNYRIVFWFDN